MSPKLNSISKYNHRIFEAETKVWRFSDPTLLQKPSQLRTLSRSVTPWLLNVSSDEDSTDTIFHPRFPPWKEMEEIRYFQKVFNFVLG